jgi:hypothetical protein
VLSAAKDIANQARCAAGAPPPTPYAAPVPQRAAVALANSFAVPQVARVAPWGAVATPSAAAGCSQALLAKRVLAAAAVLALVLLHRDLATVASDLSRGKGLSRSHMAEPR